MEIHQPAENRFLKALIFGPSGAGKTTLLGTAQHDERTAPMLLLDFEGGSESLAGLAIDVAPIREWEDYNIVFDALASGEHWTLPGTSLKKGEQYRSLGIDSISETHTFALLSILEEEGDARRDPDLIEQRDYGKASTQMRRLLREFRDLDLHVFYTSHAKEIEEKGIGRVKVPSMAGQVAEEVVGLMSMVGYLAQWEDDDGEVNRSLLLRNHPKFRIKLRTPWLDEAGIEAAGIPDELDNPTISDLLDLLDVDAEAPETPAKRQTPKGGGKKTRKEEDDETKEQIEQSIEEDEDEVEVEETQEEEGADEESGGTEGETSEEDEGEEWSWAEVKAMKKTELLETIEDYELDVDPDGMKVADLKVAVGEALGVDVE